MNFSIKSKYLLIIVAIRILAAVVFLFLSSYTGADQDKLSNSEPTTEGKVQPALQLLSTNSIETKDLDGDSDILVNNYLMEGWKPKSFLSR